MAKEHRAIRLAIKIKRSSVCAQQELKQARESVTSCYTKVVCTYFQHNKTSIFNLASGEILQITLPESPASCIFFLFSLQMPSFMLFKQLQNSSS